MNSLKYVLLLLLFGFSFLFAQFEDELLDEDEQQQQEETCVPANLLTGWDSLATVKMDQPIGLLYNYGYEYYKNKA